MKRKDYITVANAIRRLGPQAQEAAIIVLIAEFSKDTLFNASKFRALFGTIDRVAPVVIASVPDAIEMITDPVTHERRPVGYVPNPELEDWEQ